MMENKPRAYDGKMLIRVGKPRHVALLPAYVRESLLLLRSACLLQHGRSNVDARGMTPHPGKGAHQQTRPARHVQHRVLWPGARRAHNKVQRLLVAHAGRLRKWHRLPCELVKDAGLMRIHAWYLNAP